MMNWRDYNDLISVLAKAMQEQQTQIANYLDIKTQAIDKKINLLNKKANYYINFSSPEGYKDLIIKMILQPKI